MPSIPWKAIKGQRINNAISYWLRGPYLWPRPVFRGMSTFFVTPPLKGDPLRDPVRPLRGIYSKGPGPGHGPGVTLSVTSATIRIQFSSLPERNSRANRIPI